MSRPRKLTLDAALAYLREHLPRVLRSLEVVNEGQEEMRALMGKTGAIGGHGVGMDFREAHPLSGVQANDGVGHLGPRIRAVTTMPPGPPNSDTPERREFDAARKANRTVPPELANMSEAQRERMAEQRALVEAERSQRGLTRLPLAPTTAGTDKYDQVVVPDAPVREEVLPDSGNGSVGAEHQTGGFTDG